MKRYNRRLLFLIITIAAVAIGGSVFHYHFRQNNKSFCKLSEYKRFKRCPWIRRTLIFNKTSWAVEYYCNRNEAFFQIFNPTLSVKNYVAKRFVRLSLSGFKVNKECQSKKQITYHLIR